VIVVGVLSAPDPSAVAEVARRAAATGSKVEVVGVVPGDAAWDRVLYELTAAGVGHATVVRSERGSIEPADLDLALRYLPDLRAVVFVRPPAGLVPTAIAGADFAGATLVVVGPLDAGSIAALEALGARPASAAPIILDPPATDPDGTFAGFVAMLAARLDAGDQPEAAFKATVSALAVDPV
jgi:sugar/nucleoside kinase (ribokinase family)